LTIEHGDIEVPMMKGLSSAVTTALIVAAGPVFYLHAQTPDEAWPTFVGTNQPDLQPNRSYRRQLDHAG
jgi:hypothetical protein